MAARRQLLVQRRKTLGLSQEALAARLQVERSTVARWENGDTGPQLALRPKLAKILQVSPDELNDLLSRPGERNGPDQAARALPEPTALRDADPARAGGDALGPGAPGFAAAALPAGGMGAAPQVCQLPPTVADFTGRDREVGELTEVLSRDRDDRVGVPVAVIAGLPGAGKTALALQVAHLVRAAFPDGQLWVPLEGATGRPRDPGEVLGELIRALGVPGPAVPASTAERASLYRSRLADQRVLVLADDAASAAQVRPLLPGTGRCAVLITSRSDLVGPPGSQLVLLDPLSQGEAVQLLSKILGGKRIAAEPRAAAELAEACGQLPLAVRIAGARLAARTSWQLSALARKITHARRRLDEFQNGDMSVRASLTQAYQALDDQAQRAFRRLALLDSAEFTEWQAAALLGVHDATAVVARLADSSLLTATGLDAASQARYRPHDLVRDYAAEQLAAETADDQATARGRVTGGWMQLAARADAGLAREPYFPVPPPQAARVVPQVLAKDITADPIAWFTAERLPLLAVIERCCATGDHAAAAQLASYLASYWYLRGRLDDAERSWQMITIAAEQAGDPAAAARARLRLAAAACGQGRHAEASPLVDRALMTFGELDDGPGLAAALYWQSTCEWNLAAYREARRSALSSLQYSQEAGDLRGEVLALRLLALATAQLTVPGAAGDAVAAADRALALATQLGDPVLEHEVLHSVASVYHLVGRADDALQVAHAGLAMAQRFGATAATAAAEWLGILSDAYNDLGRHREAAESLNNALPIFRNHFMHRHHALCLLKLGYSYQAMGDAQAAAHYLQQSLDIFSELQVSYYQDRAREALEACQTAT